MEPLKLDLGEDADYLYWAEGYRKDVEDAQQRLERVVVACRKRGIPWARIAESLGCSKQAAQQRYGRLCGD